MAFTFSNILHYLRRQCVEEVLQRHLLATDKATDKPSLVLICRISQTIGFQSSAERCLKFLKTNRSQVSREHQWIGLVDVTHGVRSWWKWRRRTEQVLVIVVRWVRLMVEPHGLYMRNGCIVVGCPSSQSFDHFHLVINRSNIQLLVSQPRTSRTFIENTLSISGSKQLLF